VMNRCASSSVSGYVQILSTTDIMLVGRYKAADGEVYDMTQSIALNYGTRKRS